MADAYFLKFSDITGESSDEDHKEWIEITDFGQSITHDLEGGYTPSAAGGFSVGNAVIEPFTFSKSMDTSSVELMKACLTGRIIKEVTVEAVRPSAQGGDTKLIPFFVITFQNCMVANISTTGSDGALPTEECGLAFTQIKWVYKTNPEHGTPKEFQATWNRKTNRQT